MLKALELIGFKSFADKTRFEFPAGITVVVGPNGSGKSNIVDAIKWVLGEQSAKSLRGKDMADVIFKGGSSGRKMMNTAEATLILDNSERHLPVDAPEVYVTRRVYRSGEGEYLINRQPCRLKDVRDLFRGTGVGTDAYSLIEQGKVDRLLQASPRDRRAIFEEAAGISRFKAKKLEAQRRLERVEQNLLRLSDIVEEVESRLRSVRAQASKARRYREYSDRLQQLRTHVGLADWRQLTEKLEALQAERQQAVDEAGELGTEAGSIEDRLKEQEAEIGRCDEAVRQYESRIAQNREQIAGRESAMEHERASCRALEEEAVSHRRQLAATLGRAGDVLQRLRQTAAALEQAEADHGRIASVLAEHERSLSGLTGRLDQHRSQNQARRDQYVTQMRAAAALGNQIGSYESQLAGLEATAQRCQERLQELEQTAQAQQQELQQCRTAEARLAETAQHKAGLVEAAQKAITDGRQTLARLQSELAGLQSRYSGCRERASLLDELEKCREGLGTGVKELLARSQQDGGGPPAQVHGVVADLLQADVELAPLVDVALGAMAQHVVLADRRLLDELLAGSYQVTGRVGLVWLDDVQPSAAEPECPDLQGQPGVIGRADDLVEAAPAYARLVTRLLGRTWFVETLADALALRHSPLGRGLRLVTRQGALLEADGTLVIGPPQATLGLVSRRSELRRLNQQNTELQHEISQGQQQIGRLQEQLRQQDHTARQRAAEHEQAMAQLAEQRTLIRTLEERWEQLENQRRTLEAERQAALAQHQRAAEQLAATRQELAELETALAQLEAAIRSQEQQVEQIEAERQQHLQQATAAKVELGKSQQQLEDLQRQKQQFEEEQRERERALQQAQQQLAHCLQRHSQAERHLLEATSEVAQLYLHKEAYAAQAAQQSQNRQLLADERTALGQQRDTLSKRIRRLEERQHQYELSEGELRHQRTALADRLREDYGIELAQLETEPDQPPQEREQVEQEIHTLRRKVNQIGAVNMDSLDELDELEGRFTLRSGQYQDLQQAKQALERIIHRINADSRRLFLETLEAIRGNFHTLYRKAFGGGQADIVLEDGGDVLECGVEILATPPGKPSFNNSLLSGGEKALTAVALLLAIFQFRPSPFCVLDEVDAPFDEANIGRFIDVLRDFLSWTRFVIVTHSKKTMTAATTLYGVTMQESGVSKRVSVQFDDVTEDGHIRPEALQRQPDSPPAEDDERGAA